jgi:hypothetical protein
VSQAQFIVQILKGLYQLTGEESADILAHRPHHLAHVEEHASLHILHNHEMLVLDLLRALLFADRLAGRQF